MAAALCLDLATTLGWACGPFPARPLTPMEAAIAKPPQPKSGIHRIAPAGTAVGPFLNAYQTWLLDMIEGHGVAALVFEAPILPRRQTSIETVQKLVGLAGVTLMTAHQRGIRWVRSVQPSTVKRHISGFGGPGKGNVMRAILARGWSFQSDDEADALAIFDYGAHLYALERRGRAA